MKENSNKVTGDRVRYGVGGCGTEGGFSKLRGPGKKLREFRYQNITVYNCDDLLSI